MVMDNTDSLALLNQSYRLRTNINTIVKVAGDIFEHIQFLSFMVEELSDLIYTILNDNYDRLMKTAKVEETIYGMIIDRFASYPPLFKLETPDINTSLRDNLAFRFQNKLSKDMETDIYQNILNKQCGGLAVLQALKSFPAFKRIMLTLFTNTWEEALQTKYLKKSREYDWGNFNMRLSRMYLLKRYFHPSFFHIIFQFYRIQER